MRSTMQSLSIILFTVTGGAIAQTVTPSWTGPAPSGTAYPGGEETRRFEAIERNLKQRGQFRKIETEVFRKEALILRSDRDPLDVILRRTAALIDDLAGMRGAPDLRPLAAEFSDLKATAQATDVKATGKRRQLFDKACHLRRRIAFKNPLLTFGDILILKRHPTKYNHLCDQYYGAAQQPGGGLYVLTDAFGANPGIRDVLADSVVANGRLKGQRLSGGPKREWNVLYNGMGHVGGDETEGGSFLSPDISFDGKNVAFAYVECRGGRDHVHHTDLRRGHWAEQRCYHVFSVGLDGKNLRMLTDGTWNDFDPCFMPSGRIAFISERRGGYLRCGRVCPTYTLHDMAADGSGISCLSYHETNEWHPSVTHDGMILWTRWDYVDRHGVTAHAPWITTPDGRDPRAVHGNYAPRPQRPDMEADPRAIPGSVKFVATAAPHHGQSFGSLVIIDPRVEDDDRMGPVRRLTPEVGFPETQESNESALHYGQPWPLNENYYLCAYEPEGRTPSTRRYGIYLIDAFGNRELIYRDPDIACHSPIPAGSRPTPPVLPEMSKRLTEVEAGEATVSVVNVYNTQTPWKKGTKATALRVYQVFPLSVASARVPHATGYQIPQAKDSINLARAVLGTAPVEKDGSAHFTVPARVELFFQVLDEDGLAITSMRSGTHFHPGEKASCQGCHEPKHSAPMNPSLVTPLAMRRAPSRLEPEADGTRPLDYPRLVQPVLNQYCVKCHVEKNALPLDGGIATSKIVGYMNPKTTYSNSYVSLTPEFGFYDYGGKNFSDPKWYRTTPGEFGARASRLYALLRKGHYGVKLPSDAMRRITVWLDSCSPFYGVYEKAKPKTRGRQTVGRDSKRTPFDTAALGFEEIVFVKRKPYSSNHYYTDIDNGTSPDRFLPANGIYVYNLRTQSERAIVTAAGMPGGKGFIGKISLSFDAKKIVFDFRRDSRSGFRIWEVGTDGKGLRQISFPPADEAKKVSRWGKPWHTDDIHPCYLPDGKIVFSSTRCEHTILCGGSAALTAPGLHRMNADGTNIEQLTRSPVSEFCPVVLADGRVMYHRWEYVDRGARVAKTIRSMNPDGTNPLEIYGVADDTTTVYMYPQPIPGSDHRLVCVGTCHYPQGGCLGAIMLIDSSKEALVRGPDPDETDYLQWDDRFAVTNITPEVFIERRTEPGWHFRTKENRYVHDRNGQKGHLYTHPYPLSDREFLVSYKADPADHYKNVADAYALYLIDIDGKRRLVHEDDALSCWHPLPLVARRVPQLVRSSLNPEHAAKDQALCVLTNIHEGMEGVRPGEVKWLRINEALPRYWDTGRRWGPALSSSSWKAALWPRVQWGIVPVEQDGSAHFLVPANRSIFFQALDESFREIQRERTYANYRPGESRSCTGCHGRTNRAPSSARTATPLALTREPSKPQPQPCDRVENGGDGRAGQVIHYPTDIQPIFDSRCVSCHGKTEPSGGLRLTGEVTAHYNTSYEQLAKKELAGPLISEFTSFRRGDQGNYNGRFLAPRSLGCAKSTMIELLTRTAHSKNADADHSRMLTKTELMILSRWVDSNYQFYGTFWGRHHARWAKRDPKQQSYDPADFRRRATFEEATGFFAPKWHR